MINNQQLSSLHTCNRTQSAKQGDQRAVSLLTPAAKALLPSGVTPQRDFAGMPTFTGNHAALVSSPIVQGRLI